MVWFIHLAKNVPDRLIRFQETRSDTAEFFSTRSTNTKKNVHVPIKALPKCEVGQYNFFGP
jgi:hypothetical protein